MYTSVRTCFLCRAADWNLANPDWSGRLRITGKGSGCIIKLEDKVTGMFCIIEELIQYVSLVPLFLVYYICLYRSQARKVARGKEANSLIVDGPQIFARFAGINMEDLLIDHDTCPTTLPPFTTATAWSLCSLLSSALSGSSSPMTEVQITLYM